MDSLMRWLLAVTIAAVIAPGGIGWLDARPAYVFHGITTDAPRAAEFTLTAHNGTRVRLGDFLGKTVLLYFGYTHCPGICPTTLAEIDRALRTLGPAAARVQVMMVTIDPERDTPARLRAYMVHFNPTFLGLTGTPQEVAAVASRYGIYYRRDEPDARGDYLIDHTSMVIVIDPTGRVRLLFPFGTTVEAMASDLNHLLGGPPARSRG
jgi:protein SCO1/2